MKFSNPLDLIKRRDDGSPTPTQPAAPVAKKRNNFAWVIPGLIILFSCVCGLFLYAALPEETSPEVASFNVTQTAVVAMITEAAKPKAPAAISSPGATVKSGTSAPTAVGKTASVSPTPSSKTAPSEEEGGLPFGLVVIFVLFIAVLVVGTILLGIPPRWPLVEIGSEEQTFIRSRISNEIRKIGQGTYVVKRLIEEVSATRFPSGVITVEIPQRTVSFKAGAPSVLVTGNGGSVQSEQKYIAVKFDAEIYVVIEDLVTMIRRLRDITRMKDIVVRVMVGFMETMPRQYTFHQLESLRQALLDAATRKLQSYGLKVEDVAISNADYADEKLRSAVEQETIQTAQADAEKSATLRMAQAERQFMDTLGFSPSEYILYKAAIGAGPLGLMLMNFVQDIGKGRPPEKALEKAMEKAAAIGVDLDAAQAAASADEGGDIDDEEDGEEEE